MPSSASFVATTSSRKSVCINKVLRKQTSARDIRIQIRSLSGLVAGTVYDTQGATAETLPRRPLSPAPFLERRPEPQPSQPQLTEDASDSLPLDQSQQNPMFTFMTCTFQLCAHQYEHTRNPQPWHCSDLFCRIIRTKHIHSLLSWQADIVDRLFPCYIASTPAL